MEVNETGMLPRHETPLFFEPEFRMLVIWNLLLTLKAKPRDRKRSV
jgi:hypothetical protein